MRARTFCHLCCFVALLLSSFLTASLAAAQTASPPAKNEFAAWFSGEFENGHAFGNTINGRLYEIEGRYGRLFFAQGPVAFRYVVEVVPLALVGDPNYPDGQRHYVYGGGASPIGVQLNLRHYRRAEPFLTSSGGFVYMQRRLFNPGATQFNFTVQLGGGVQLFALNRRTAVDLGYKYFHISNANMNHRNPAMDSHMLFIGLSFFR